MYTSNTQTLMLLNAIDALPLVDIGDVYQCIDAKTMTAHNKVCVLHVYMHTKRCVCVCVCGGGPRS